MIRTNNRVVLYARYSSDNQRSESIDAQIRAMKEYCKHHNYIIVETYVDEARTATTDKRPSFQRMIKDSAGKTFDIVLVHKLDRFARNRYDSAIYKRELKKNGVSVYSVLEKLDNSPESIIMESVLDGFSEYYSKNLARETMKGMKETALQCKHTGGKAPLGYDVDPITRKLIINEYEAESVRIIFEMYSKGYGYSPILEVLNAEGRKTKKGQAFMKNSLHSILTNPKYKGMYVFNRSSAKSYAGTRNTHLYKDEENIIAIEGGCPAIVTPDVYEKVQDRMTYNKHRGAEHIAKENYLLSGKVFYKECGRSMCGNARHGGRNKELYVTYRCPTKKYACSNKEINRDYLEEYVIMLLEKHIFNTRALKRLSKGIVIYGNSNNTKERQRQLQAQLAEIEEALKNVADAIQAGLISSALVTRLNELETEKAIIENKLADMEKPVEISIDTGLIMSEYTRVKQTPASPEHKTFIKGFIDKIVVGKYTVDVTLKTGLDICGEMDMTVNVPRREVYERKKGA